MKHILYAAIGVAFFLVGCGSDNITGSPPLEDNRSDLTQSDQSTGTVENPTPNTPPGGGPGIAPYDPVSDYQSLIVRLQISGATVETAGEVSQPFFSVKGQAITVNGTAVQVFEFADAAAAKAEALRVPQDGRSFDTLMITWIGTPRFYAAGRVIILYVGDDKDVVDTLETVLSRPFAGGDRPVNGNPEPLPPIPIDPPGGKVDGQGSTTGFPTPIGITDGQVQNGGDQTPGHVAVPIGEYPDDVGPVDDPRDLPPGAEPIVDVSPPIAIDPIPDRPANNSGVIDEPLPTVRKVDIRGTVSTIREADAKRKTRGIIATVLIEGPVTEDTIVDKAIVTITRETRIYEQNGQNRREVSVDALKTGLRAQALFTGPVMESYPVQATASEIVILK
ncbi:MAG: hypothetical protein O7G87_15035 [bacterium]|nr:hypothetical protein [bacterium]